MRHCSYRISTRYLEAWAHRLQNQLDGVHCVSIGIKIRAISSKDPHCTAHRTAGACSTRIPYANPRTRVFFSRSLPLLPLRSLSSVAMAGPGIHPYHHQPWAPPHPHGHHPPPPVAPPSPLTVENPRPPLDEVFLLFLYDLIFI
jgi:hypothetical protein